MVERNHFRRTARRPVELTVRYRREVETLEHRGRLLDLGLGGAQVRCEQAPEVGARLHIVLGSPSSWDPLDLPADVRWVDGDVFGVAFERLSPSQAAALHELLAVSAFDRSTLDHSEGASS